jgi:hypothetical protein
VQFRLSCVGTGQPANYLNLIISFRIYIQTTVQNFLLFIGSEAFLLRLQEIATWHSVKSSLNSDTHFLLTLFIVAYVYVYIPSRLNFNIYNVICVYHSFHACYTFTHHHLRYMVRIANCEAPFYVILPQIYSWYFVSLLSKYWQCYLSTRFWRTVTYIFFSLENFQVKFVHFVYILSFLCFYISKARIQRFRKEQ